MSIGASYRWPERCCLGKIRGFSKSVLTKLSKKNLIRNDTIENVAIRDDSFFHYLSGSDEEITCQKPALLEKSEIPDLLRRLSRPFKFPPAFVCELREVDLFGPPALAFKGFSPILENSVAREDCLAGALEQIFDRQGAVRRFLLRKRFAEQEETGAVCSLVNIWSKGYFSLVARMPHPVGSPGFLCSVDRH
jgi:hypothetical protein